jgi:hypothetical protein
MDSEKDGKELTHFAAKRKQGSSEKISFQCQRAVAYPEIIPLAFDKEGLLKGTSRTPEYRYR